MPIICQIVVGSGKRIPLRRRTTQPQMARCNRRRFSPEINAVFSRKMMVCEQGMIYLSKVYYVLNGLQCALCLQNTVVR